MSNCWVNHKYLHQCCLNLITIRFLVGKQRMHLECCSMFGTMYYFTLVLLGILERSRVCPGSRKINFVIIVGRARLVDWGKLLLFAEAERRVWEKNVSANEKYNSAFIDLIYVKIYACRNQMENKNPIHSKTTLTTSPNISLCWLSEASVLALRLSSIYLLKMIVLAARWTSG